MGYQACVKASEKAIIAEKATVVAEQRKQTKGGESAAKRSKGVCYKLHICVHV